MSRGTAGDVVPFLKIGSVLAGMNNDVLLVTHCYYEQAVHRAGLQFAALDTPREFEAFVKDGPLLETTSGLLEFSKKHVFPQTRSEITLLDGWCQKKGVVLVTRHMASIAAPLICERYRLPLVTVFVSAAQANCFHLWTEFCRSLLADVINGFRAELELPRIHDWRAWVNIPSCFLACWPQWFSPRTSVWPGHTKHVGFLLSDATETGKLVREVEHLLDLKPPPVLISGGTSVSTMSRRFYAAAAAACYLACRTAILVCRHKELIPDPLPPGIRCFRQLPFASIVPRVAALIHHGGASTMVRAAASGVPQLILPFGADRPHNAACIERVGLGLQVRASDWEPSRVFRELERVIDSASIRHTLSEIPGRLLSPVDLENACTMIEGVANHAIRHW